MTRIENIYMIDEFLNATFIVDVDSVERHYIITINTHDMTHDVACDDDDTID
jgi:hypothetical protein